MPFDEFVNDERPGARRFRDILERERRDMAWLVHAVACLYDEISGGLISKPMTYPDEVIGAFNERIDREVDLAVAAERARIEDRLVALYRQSEDRAAVALVCDEAIDRSGAMLGRVRDKARIVEGEA